MKEEVGTTVDDAPQGSSSPPPGCASGNAGPASSAQPELLPGSSTNADHVRVILTDQQLDTMAHDELVRLWRVQDSFIDYLEGQAAANEAELGTLREVEERSKQQHTDLLLREKVLVRRLAAKEQEIQEYAGQLSELKANQTPSAVAMRSALLDPAVNLLLQRLRQELATTRSRLEETQNELSAWKFTPDSNTGKRLMAKCRLLYQENEELGRMISSGRLAKLEGDLALQKSFSEEVKKSQSELDEFLQDLDEDVEGMQSTIYYLQQELRKSKETVAGLEQEVASLRAAAGGDSNRTASSSSSSKGIVNGLGGSPTRSPDSVPCAGGDGDRTDRDDCIERTTVVVKKEERTNGVSSNKEADRGGGDGGFEEDEERSRVRGRESDEERTSVNNNRVSASSPPVRKRAASEDSDETPPPSSKKIKVEAECTSDGEDDRDSSTSNDNKVAVVNGDLANSTAG